MMEICAVYSGGGDSIAGEKGRFAMIAFVMFAKFGQGKEEIMEYIIRRSQFLDYGYKPLFSGLEMCYVCVYKR